MLSLLFTLFRQNAWNMIFSIEIQVKYFGYNPRTFWHTHTQTNKSESSLLKCLFELSFNTFWNEPREQTKFKRNSLHVRQWIADVKVELRFYAHFCGFYSFESAYIEIPECCLSGYFLFFFFHGWWKANRLDCNRARCKRNFFYRKVINWTKATNDLIQHPTYFVYLLLSMNDGY